MGPAPAVATVRRALRSALGDIPSGGLVLVACSGGPDSLALAAAAAFEAPRSDWRAGAITVDHGLQPNSADRAESVADVLRGLGLGPVENVRVRVGEAGGPEAAARDARYRALDAAAARHGAAAVLLGHTRDDQAETVLLGLARGSGARSLAGMASVSGRYRRPLLDLPRSATEAACASQQLVAWSDPHNTDPAYTRVRVRGDALPALERALGGGVAAALARTADLLRADADALEDWAAAVPIDTPVDGGDGEDGGGGESAHDPYEVGVEVERLAELPRAVRGRVLQRAAVTAGCPAGVLAATHIRAAEALVVDWHRQQGADLPGGVSVHRRCGRLLFTKQIG